MSLIKPGTEPSNIFLERPEIQKKTEKIPEIPEEFRYPLAYTTQPDRYGTVGTMDATGDWRPQEITISYREIPLTEGLQTFFDDHRRSLNDQIAHGGRDMRKFAIADKEIQHARQERRNELENIANMLIDELGQRLRPPKIAVGLEKKGQGHKWFDDDLGNMSETTTFYTLVWYGTGIKKYVGDISSNQAGSVFDTPNYEQLLQEGDAEATIFFQKELERLRQTEESEEIIQKKEHLKKVLDEIALIDGSLELYIPVYIAKDMSEEERRQHISEITQKNASLSITKYHPKQKQDPLREYGVAAIQEWYTIQGINTQAKTIDFPKNPDVLRLNIEELTRRAKEEQMRQAQADEDTKRKAVAATLDQTRKKIEGELTPENKTRIQQSLQKMEVLFEILTKTPGATPELQKFKNQLPRGILVNLKNAFEHSQKGLDILVDIEKLEISLKDLSSRKKLATEMPSLWEKAQVLLREWEQIDQYIVENQDASVVLDGEAITLDELTQRISIKYLENPWNTSVRDIVQQQTEIAMTEI